MGLLPWVPAKLRMQYPPQDPMVQPQHLVLMLMQRRLMSLAVKVMRKETGRTNRTDFCMCCSVWTRSDADAASKWLALAAETQAQGKCAHPQIGPPASNSKRTGNINSVRCVQDKTDQALV